MSISMRPAGRTRAATVGAVVAVLLASAAVAHATITPSIGGPQDSFEMTFPAVPVALDVWLSGPRGCRELDDLYIPIRRARTGRYRFGPRVPGARPRRNGRRINRWCRGRYRVRVLEGEEFLPGGRVIATARFTVR